MSVDNLKSKIKAALDGKKKTPQGAKARFLSEIKGMLDKKQLNALIVQDAIWILQDLVDSEDMQRLAEMGEYITIKELTHKRRSPRGDALDD